MVRIFQCSNKQKGKNKMNLAAHQSKTNEVVNSLGGNNENRDFKKQNIWFSWGDKNEHTIRLVDDFIMTMSHWIGKSKFGKDYQMFPDRAFVGDNKLANKIACENWDVECESMNDNGCPICKLEKNCNAIIADKTVDANLREEYKILRDKCRPQAGYMFKCIDRDNPYIADGEKGYKIIQLTKGLLESIVELDKKLDGVELTSKENGIDIVIKREPPASGKGATKYTATPVYQGLKIKQTPLTEEELQYHDLDLKKFAGKVYESEVLVDKFTDDTKAAYDLEESADGMPF